jgi:hypothetical protein
MRATPVCWLGVLLGTCLAIFLAPNPAAAGDAHLANASSSRNGQIYSVSFVLLDAFDSKREEAILSGIPQTFNYVFEVYRVITAWPNMRVYNWTVKRTIRYDTLKKIFTVEFDEDAKPKQTSDFPQAKKWMTEFADFPVAVAPALEASSSYYVRVKATTETVELPFYVNRVFTSSWNFETAWQRIDLPAKVAHEPTAPAP